MSRAGFEPGTFRSLDKHPTTRPLSPQNDVLHNIKRPGSNPNAWSSVRQRKSLFHSWLRGYMYDLLNLVKMCIWTIKTENTECRVYHRYHVSATLRRQKSNFATNSFLLTYADFLDTIWMRCIHAHTVTYLVHIVLSAKVFKYLFQWTWLNRVEWSCSLNDDLFILN